MEIIKNDKGQAVVSKSIKFSKEAFENHNNTEIRWLGNGGVMINSHGTCLMIDPLLEGFDMDLLMEMPINVKEVPSLDGILITHIDNDHFSRMTCNSLKDVTKKYYSVNYVADVMKEEGYNVCKLDINDVFNINDIKVRVTPALHNWQNNFKKWQYRTWEMKDYCGYYLETKEGKIWMVGDSKLLDEHLKQEEPDVILFDFSDNIWHISLEGAIKLANNYPNAKLLCIHWGCVDAFDNSAFNANPEDLFDKVVNPERILILAPGELYTL